MRASTGTPIRTKLALFVLGTVVVACGTDVGPERIVGTDKVGHNGSGDIITVSPSGDWLVFMESSANDGSAKNLRPCSINLKTGEKTVHRVDRLPGPRIPLSSGVTLWSYVASGFSVDCWQDEKCHVDMLDRGGVKDLAFVPGVPEAIVAPLPAKRVCSDCPPAGVAAAIAKERKMPLRSRRGTYSVAYRDGQLSTSMYYAKPDSRGALIWRDDGAGDPEPIYEGRRLLKRLTVMRVRISPDERFLAYVIESKLRAPIPLPDAVDELYVKNLETGEERKVAEYRVVGDLVWGPDSRLLYYSGFRERPDQAVYVLDVLRFFGEEE